jgi:hypothetical protein
MEENDKSASYSMTTSKFWNKYELCHLMKKMQYWLFQVYNPQSSFNAFTKVSQEHEASVI